MRYLFFVFIYFILNSHLSCQSNSQDDCFVFNSNRIVTINEFKDADYLNGCKIPNIQTNSIDGDKIRVPNSQKKYTFIVCWFMSCPPCLSEVPLLIDLQKNYNDVVNVIAFTYEKRDDVSRFIERHNINYKNVCDAPDIIKELQINGYPTNFLIDSTGTILLMTRGFVNDKDSKYLKLKEILNH